MRRPTLPPKTQTRQTRTLRPAIRRVGWFGLLVIATTLAVTQPAAAQEAFRTDNIRRLSDWLMLIALSVCVGGIFISAALWAIGSKGQNPGQELTGKKGIVLCLTAAFFLGILGPLVSFFENVANKDAATAGIDTSASTRDSQTQAERQ